MTTPSVEERLARLDERVINHTVDLAEIKVSLTKVESDVSEIKGKFREIEGGKKLAYVLLTALGVIVGYFAKFFELFVAAKGGK